jgi:transposase
MNEALVSGVAPADSDTGHEGISFGEGRMVREDCWREVHRLYHVERRSKSEIARQLELDRKTVRGILQAHAWQPYIRAERADTLLADHAAYLRSRAPAVQYSARILFQELRRERCYGGAMRR